MTRTFHEIQCSKCNVCLGGVTLRQLKGTVLCNKCFQKIVGVEEDNG